MLRRTVLLMLIFDCSAKDLGTIAKVMPIKEQSLLTIIQQRLHRLQASGDLEQHQKSLQEKAVRQVEHPTPVAGISKARHYTARLYDPSIIINEDIKDHVGTVIVRKGTRYNPLEDHSFGEPLLFIDGEDPDQVRWALSQEGKKVLVRGAPLKLARIFKTKFYFDQGGTLTTRLGIPAVPAKVSQKESVLLVETINMP